MIARPVASLVLASAIFLTTPPAAESAANPRLGFPLPPAHEVGRLQPASGPALTLSFDGKILYTGDTEGLISIWDVATRTKLRELKAPRGLIQTMALSSDNQYLISGSSNGSVIIWDLKSGAARHEIKFDDQILSVAISPDGESILAAARKSAIRLINLSTGETIGQFGEPDATLGYLAVAFLDKKYGVARRYSQKIVVWELDTGRVCTAFSGPDDTRLKVDSTGKWLLATGNFEAALWPMEEIRKAITSGKETEIHAGSLIRFHDKLQGIAYSRIPFDHWHFGPSKGSGTFDPRRGLISPVRRAEPMEIAAADVAPDGRTAVVAYWDRTIRIFDLNLFEDEKAWRVASEYVSTLAASPGGKLLLSTDPNGETKVWNPTTGENVFGMNRRDLPLARPGALLSEGDELLAVIGTEPFALMNLRTGQMIKKSALPMRLWCCRGDPTGKFLLAGYVSPGTRAPDPTNPLSNPYQIDRVSALQIYDRDLKQIGDGFAAHLQVGVRAAVFSPNGALVASLDDSGDARVFDFSTRRQISSAKISISEATDLAVTNDGVLIAVSAVGSITAYQATTGEKLITIAAAHSKQIRHIALSPNGRLAATMAEDSLVKLWSWPDLKSMGGFEGAKPDQYMGSVLFLDDDTIAVGGVGGIVHVWKIKDAINFEKWNVCASGPGGSAIAISTDGTRIGIGDGAGVLHVIDPEGNKELAAVPAHARGIRDVQFVGESHRIVTTGRDGLKLWDTDVSRNFAPAPVGYSSAPHFVLPADNKYQLQVRDDGLHFQGDGPNSGFLPLYGSRATRYLPDQDCLIVAAPSGIWIVDLAKRSFVWGYDVPSFTSALALDEKRHELITTHDDGVVRRWKLPDKLKSLRP